MGAYVRQLNVKTIINESRIVVIWCMKVKIFSLGGYFCYKQCYSSLNVIDFFVCKLLIKHFSVFFLNNSKLTLDSSYIMYNFPNIYKLL